MIGVSTDDWATENGTTLEMSVVVPDDFFIPTTTLVSGVAGGALLRYKDIVAANKTVR
jgi:hypothetical protein